jgi:hypothetical protein
MGRQVFDRQKCFKYSARMFAAAFRKKNAVELYKYKNMIGPYHQPRGAAGRAFNRPVLYVNSIHP